MMDQDLEITILCALDYALPRETYAGGCVRATIKKQWDNFPRACDASMMFRDVIQALHEGRAGAEMDRREWFDFLWWMRGKMNTEQHMSALEMVRHLRPCIPDVEDLLNKPKGDAT